MSTDIYTHVMILVAPKCTTNVCVVCVRVCMCACACMRVCECVCTHAHVVHAREGASTTVTHAYMLHEFFSLS